MFIALSKFNNWQKPVDTSAESHFYLNLKYFSVLDQISLNKEQMMRLRVILLFLFATFLITAESNPILLPLEFPQAFEEIYFDCNDNKFISKDLICNGREDCSNGADEEFCQKWSTKKWREQLLTSSLTIYYRCFVHANKFFN